MKLPTIPPSEEPWCSYEEKIKPIKDECASNLRAALWGRYDTRVVELCHVNSKQATNATLMSNIR